MEHFLRRRCSSRAGRRIDRTNVISWLARIEVAAHEPAIREQWKLTIVCRRGERNIPDGWSLCLEFDDTAAVRSLERARLIGHGCELTVTDKISHNATACGTGSVVVAQDSFGRNTKVLNNVGLLGYFGGKESFELIVEVLETWIGQLVSFFEKVVHSVIAAKGTGQTRKCREKERAPSLFCKNRSWWRIEIWDTQSNEK